MMQTDDTLAGRLKAHVYRLSHEIGERSIRKYSNLNEAADYITEQFQSFGYKVDFQGYTTQGKYFKNIIVTKEGDKAPDEIVILGAHYDTKGNPGADDNASALAGLLETARALCREKLGRTIKFAAFTNEEPPFFKKRSMGSRVFVDAARKAGDNIVGVVILEMIGYYSNKRRSQRHPPGLNIFYPNTGNFIGVVAEFKSRWLLKKTVSSFRAASKCPIEWILVPSLVIGIGMSDDWAFWNEGYPVEMITDTAYYRNPNYHKRSDTFDTLNYEKMAEVTAGIGAVIKDIAGKG